MNLNEIDLNRSDKWLTSLQTAFDSGKSGKSLYGNIDKLVDSLDDDTRNQLIAVLQQQLATEPVDRDLQVAQKFGEKVDKFADFTKKLASGVKSFNNLVAGNRDDISEIFHTKEFKQFVWKIEKNKPIIPSDYRLLDSIVRRIPDTQNYRVIKRIIKKLIKKEELTDKEKETLKYVSDESSDDNDY